MIDFGTLREIVENNPPYEWLYWALMYHNGDMPVDVVMEYVKRKCGYVPVAMWLGERGANTQISEAYKHESDQLIGYANIGGNGAIAGWWGNMEHRTQAATYDLVRVPTVDAHWRPWALENDAHEATAKIDHCLALTREWIDAGAPVDGDLRKTLNSARAAAWRSAQNAGGDAAWDTAWSTVWTAIWAAARGAAGAAVLFSARGAARAKHNHNIGKRIAMEVGQ